MNWKSPSAIFFYCMVLISIICFCLTNIANVFCIIGSITLTISFLMLTWWSFVRYLIYRRNMQDKRMSDAYIYAEKIGNEEAIENFSYSSSKERKLRYDKFNHFLIPLCFSVLSVISVFLFLICIKVI